MPHTVRPRVISLMFLISFASVGIASISPALPDIVKHYGISAGYAQHLILWYLAGYALGQLPYGPLASYFGNRKVTVTSMCVSVVLAASLFLGIPLHSVMYLCVIRFLLGLTTAVGLKMAYTLLSHHFTTGEVKKLSGYLMMSFALAPGLGIFIVGAVVTWIGFSGAFIFQFCYCILGLLVSLTLPHGHHDTRRTIHPLHVLAKYWQCLREPRIFLPGILMTTGAANIYLFTSEAPFIAIKHLGAAPFMYGLLFFLMCFGTVTGSLLSGFFSHKMGKMRFVFWGMVLISAGSIAMLGSFLASWIVLTTLFIPMFVMRIGIPPVVSNSATYALETEHHSKSYISSTINFINMGIAVLFVLFQSLFRADHYVLLPILLVAAAALGWVALFFEKLLIAHKD